MPIILPIIGNTISGISLDSRFTLIGNKGILIVRSV